MTTKRNPADLVKNPLSADEVLILRTCNADMSSAYDKEFIWPEQGVVEAPDWKDSKDCGHGLHGLNWGIGVSQYLDWNHAAKWLVVRVNKSDGFVELDDKCKFKKGFVAYAGNRQGAIALLVQNGACARGAVVGVVVTAGDRGTATAGDRGTATARDYGTATAGYRGTATARDYGTATAGYHGTATAGYYGTAAAGDCGIIALAYWDSKRDRLIPVIGAIGENGLKPNTKYRLNEKHEFEEVSSSK